MYAISSTIARGASMLRNDMQGMIPSPGNPYIDNSDQYVAPREVPEPTVLTMRDVDRMVRAKLDDARREAHEEARRHCLRAWEDGCQYGRREGFERGAQSVRDQVKRTNGTLMWIKRRLQERSGATRTTIAAERDVIAREANNLEAVFTQLLRIESGESE